MKKTTILYTFLIILTSLFQVYSQENNIIFVYDFCINGTIMEVDLETVEEDYIYYYYDFNSSCFQYKKRTVNYFEILSNIDIMNDQNLLNYALLEKAWDNYEEIHRIDVKGLDYKGIKYLKKEKRR